VEKIQNEKKLVLLVGINKGNDELFNYEMKEMENLCEAKNLLVVDWLVQNLDTAVPATYIGSGKLEELKIYSEEQEIDYVIFNDELSPVQFKNITNYLNVDVLDRTMLILEIFKERANSKEAIIQVEIAELKYQLPRLAGSYASLSKLGGGGGGASGARRGAGETALELDKRHIEKRISKLKCELDEIVTGRLINRKARIKSNIPTVALVGYTNAGKSSTLNSILKMFKQDLSKEVFVKDMLFATLDTSTRSIKLPNNKTFLLTDTVGFVSKLPHHLVQSFKSTLEEIKEANLILHIVDASNPFVDLQIETTNKVLDELGIQDIPMIYVFNKIDQVPNRQFIPKSYTPFIYLSNQTNEGFNDLINAIEKNVFNDFETHTYLIPYTFGEVFNTLKEKAEVESFSYLNDGIYVKATLSKHLANLYKQYEK